MRLDRFLSVNGVATRREAERRTCGRILVNGLPEATLRGKLTPWPTGWYLTARR